MTVEARMLGIAHFVERHVGVSRGIRGVKNSDADELCK